MLGEPGRMAATSNRWMRPDESHPGEAAVNQASTNSDDPIVFFDHEEAVRLRCGIELEFTPT
jgi:hypothetical protein